MTNNQYLADQVRRALDEMADRPMAVTAQRATRIAIQMGDTALAAELGFELRSIGASPTVNGDNTRRLLLSDSDEWENQSLETKAEFEQAFANYSSNREIKNGQMKGQLAAHSLAEIERILEIFDLGGVEQSLVDVETVFTQAEMFGIVDRVRHRCFTALCQWERQLTYVGINEQIFERFRTSVDSELARGAPEILDQFNVLYRRLHDTVAVSPDSPISDELLSQATTTCRRILKAVADHVLPPQKKAKSEDGHALDDPAYRNRIFEFVKLNTTSDGTKTAIDAAVGGVYERFASIDALTSKGVHARVGVREAELCAISTYMVAGELLRLHRESNQS